ncbi:glycosyltransferase family 4 protein [Emcibacter sp. SYSU 3D8]|uniref:glycosyltransferase family 4 protein n=1 Tax=Emcibacter sp. SYSU 3D8 TaxID=3133969 RepID=UPI0031FEF362
MGREQKDVRPIPERLAVADRLRIVICYPLVNAYMAACWRELAARVGVDLFVIGFKPEAGDLVAFTTGIMAGVPSRLLAGAERREAKVTADLVGELRPDLLLISGWSEPAFRPLYADKRLKDVPKVLMMDNQLRRTLRQYVGRLALRPMLRHVDHFFVTGERAWQYARFLGIGEDRIQRGAVSIDYKALAPIYDQRVAGLDGWPRSFFFAGRYHPRKAIDLMLDAYGRYRARRPDAWPLVAAGMGPMAGALAGREGVTDLGFVDPHAMPLHWRAAGVFVIPSRFDAWPLVIVEAAAAGLPIIASEACGSTVENVRHFYNGLVIPTEDVGRLCDALLWMHDNGNRLPVMGARSRSLAAAYGADVWTDRVLDMAARLVPGKRAASAGHL